MPTYQYVCTECAEPLEVVQSFSDAPLTECPACEGRLRKVFSAVGVVFKGSGFYKTDSRSGRTASTTTASSESSGSSGSSGSATESKPAADKPSAGTTSTPKSTGTTGSSGSASTAPAAKSA